MEIKEFIEKFEDVLDDTDINTLEPNTKFRELDEWTSMTALSTMAMICEEYDVEMSVEEMRNSNTFQDLYDIVISNL